MSPSRTRRPVARVRDRSEIVTAVVVSAAIVVGTLLLIWAMRPATPGIPGSGGIMTRQPRASMLIVGTLLVGGFVTWFIRRDRHRRRFSGRQLIAFSMVVLLILASIAAVVWPGGLLRHYPSRAAPPATVPSSASTTKPSVTTKPSTSATTRPTTPTTRRP